jgi:uncharacterized membrane protein
MKSYLAIGLLLASFSAQGALHKWVDADGKVHYSDTVPDSNVKTQTLRSSSAAESPATASSAAAPKTLAEREAEMKKAQQAKAQTAEKAAKEKEIADAQRQNCESARNNLNTLENAPRLVTYDAQGERSYLDDDARQQRIDDARAMISKYCK